MRFLPCPALGLLLFVLPLTAAAESAVDDRGVSHSVRAVTGLGLSGFGGPGLQLAGQFDYWLTPHFAFGGDGGLLAASSGLDGSEGVHAGISTALRSSSEPKHWLLSATLGPGYADASDTWCTDDFSWNEGHCETTRWKGPGAHFGLQAGRMGGTRGRQLGLLARVDFISPKFALATLNLAFGY